jgi:ribA/ribD-fused uncharacterized protein
MIDSFTNEYRFLSNFFPAEIFYEGILYPTVEHAYQAAKSNDFIERFQISLIPASLAGAAKREGRKVQIDERRWNSQKVKIMRDLLRIKFSHPRLKELLIDTEEEFLVEGNSWGDTFWGVCHGKGKNILGLLLMNTRTWLRREEEKEKEKEKEEEKEL